MWIIGRKAKHTSGGWKIIMKGLSPEKQAEFSAKLQALLKEYNVNLAISNPQIIVIPAKGIEPMIKS